MGRTVRYCQRCRAYTDHDDVPDPPYPGLIQLIPWLLICAMNRIMVHTGCLLCLQREIEDSDARNAGDMERQFGADSTWDHVEESIWSNCVAVGDHHPTTGETGQNCLLRRICSRSSVRAGPWPTPTDIASNPSSSPPFGEAGKLPIVVFGGISFRVLDRQAE